jgi:CBS domain-containing protein
MSKKGTRNTMVRAYDIMTRAVATATPKTSVSQVARMMRDLNIGDVLVLEDGKLRGIVTDRDLTTQVLTNGANTQAPIESYITTDVVTGSPDWSVEQIANVMGKHQIRRLPIVQDNSVVGIVSLGDVALHTQKQATVAESLKNISEVTRTRFRQAGPMAKILGLAIPVALAVGVVVFANTKSGKQVRQQLQASDLPYRARVALNDTFQALQDPRTRQAALEAIESTGIPERARGLIHDGTRTMQDMTHERAEQIAELTQRQARQFPDQITHLVQKPKQKRFIFA